MMISKSFIAIYRPTVAILSGLVLIGAVWVGSSWTAETGGDDDAGSFVGSGFAHFWLLLLGTFGLLCALIPTRQRIIILSIMHMLNTVVAVVTMVMVASLNGFDRSSDRKELWTALMVPAPLVLIGGMAFSLSGLLWACKHRPRPRAFSHSSTPPLSMPATPAPLSPVPITSSSSSAPSSSAPSSTQSSPRASLFIDVSMGIEIADSVAVPTATPVPTGVSTLRPALLMPKHIRVSSSSSSYSSASLSSSSLLRASWTSSLSQLLTSSRTWASRHSSLVLVALCTLFSSGWTLVACGISKQVGGGPLVAMGVLVLIAWLLLTIYCVSSRDVLHLVAALSPAMALAAADGSTPLPSYYTDDFEEDFVFAAPKRSPPTVRPHAIAQPRVLLARGTPDSAAVTASDLAPAPRLLVIV